MVENKIRETLDLIIEDHHHILPEISEAACDQLVEGIIAANRVFVAGAGRSLLMMKAFAMRLMHIGIPVFVVGETSTPAAANGDLLIIGSGSGETATMKAITQKANAIRLDIALITTNESSTIAKSAKTVVKIPAALNHLSKSGASRQPGGNSFEQAILLLTDALAMEVSRRKGVDISGSLGLHANLE